MENSKENRKAISINIKMEGRCLSLCCAQQREREKESYVDDKTKQRESSEFLWSSGPESPSAISSSSENGGLSLGFRGSHSLFFFCLSLILRGNPNSQPHLSCSQESFHILHFLSLAIVIVNCDRLGNFWFQSFILAMLDLQAMFCVQCELW